MAPSPQDFVKANLPDYEGESARVVQLWMIMAVVWLFVLPSLLSQPIIVQEGTSNTALANAKPTYAGQERSSSSTKAGTTTSGNKKVTKKRKVYHTTEKTKSGGGGNNNNKNASQPDDGQDLPAARYIPLWANVVCIAGFCSCVVYFLFILSPYNYYTPRRVFEAPLFTEEECQHVIDMAQRAAERNLEGLTNKTDPLWTEPLGWQKTRHGTYPTTDLNLVTDPFTKQDRESLSDILNRRLSPSIERFFGLPPASIRMQDLFVVRYDAGKRAHLANHTDDADISFNVLLTDDFEGGGTRFWNRHFKQPFAHVEPTQVGTFLTHGAQINHEGYHVSKGTRMILVGFANIDRFDPWMGQSTGLSWLASWLNMSWTHIRMRAGWRLNAIRAEKNEQMKFYDGQLFRLLFRDIINILEMIGDQWKTHAVTQVVDPANATAYLQALDAEYQAKGQYRPKANWFKGQNVDLDMVSRLLLFSYSSLEISSRSGPPSHIAQYIHLLVLLHDTGWDN